MGKIEKQSLIPEEIIRNIHWIRGEKVILDEDLATLYGVEVKRLKEAVRRNRNRFPSDFLLELTWDEFHSLRSQFASLKRGQHSKFLPFGFTEQGVAMLSSVLRSETAILVNIDIMRAFVHFRRILEVNTVLAGKIYELEKNIVSHDEKLKLIFKVIRQLMDKPKETLPSRRKIGYNVEKDSQAE